MQFKIPEGSLERIDPPNPQPENVERCFDVFYQQDPQNPRLFHQRNVFIRKEGIAAYLVVLGLGGDVVWWKHLTTLPNYAFFELVASETMAPRVGSTVLMVSVLIQEIDAGKQEEWRTLVTNLPVRRA